MGFNGWQRLWVLIGVLWGAFVWSQGPAMVPTPWTDWIGVLLFIWLFPWLVLYGVGWAVAWVRRGFRTRAHR